LRVALTLSVRALPIEQTRALRHAVLRPHQDIAELAAHETAGAYAVGAYDGEELVAVGFVAPDGDGWRVRGMATAPPARGRGAGAAVLDALVAYATAQGATRVWAKVRTPARSLYERAGFSVVSEEFELPDIGPHVVMERQPPARTTR
jgi:GNAT superfamily N-acetyltransferase